jgi:hypothetical protein
VTSPRQDRALALAQLAGLIATAWLVWRIWRRAPWETLQRTFILALSVSALAWAASAIITLYILLIVSSDDPSRIRRETLRRSSEGIWFAPAMVLLTILSPAAFAASVALATNTARLLAIQCFRPGPAVKTTRGLFDSFDPAFLRWRSIPALSGGFAALAGAIAVIWRTPFIAAALFIATAAIVTAIHAAANASESPKPAAAPPSGLSMILTILLAMLMSAGGIQLKRSGWGAQTGQAAPEKVVTSLYMPPSSNGSGSMGVDGDGYPGIILRPDAPPSHGLTIPRLSSMSSVQPISMLPFSGEYWMYRVPQRRPPPNSFVAKSTPAEQRYHTVDRWPMSMDAIQPLRSPLDVSCCSAIRVWIRNRDLATASLEMLLIDSSSGQKLSLGALATTSEALTFRVPASEQQRFDTIKIAFWRGASFVDKSVKIAIERFEFLPR